SSPDEGDPINRRAGRGSSKRGEPVLPRPPPVGGRGDRPLVARRGGGGVLRPGRDRRRRVPGNGFLSSRLFAGPWRRPRLGGGGVPRRGGHVRTRAPRPAQGRGGIWLPSPRPSGNRAGGVSRRRIPAGGPVPPGERVGDHDFLHPGADNAE